MILLGCGLMGTQRNVSYHLDKLVYTGLFLSSCLRAVQQVRSPGKVLVLPIIASLPLDLLTCDWARYLAC